MKEGEIVLANLPQSDNSYKLWPVLILKQLPGFSDFLVCGISTQLHQYIDGFDELLDENHYIFEQTGLKQSSIIRLTFLAVIPNDKIPGKIGQIPSTINKALLERLSNFLLS